MQEQIIKDPYLVPGVVCEVWDKGLFKYRRPVYFLKYDDTGTKIEPLFSDERPEVYCKDGFKANNYWVLNTEWTFSPDWAVCIAIEATGKIRYFSEIPYTYESCNYWIPNNESKVSVCGICPDKTRYQGEAWKDSLRSRPVWAEGK